MIQQKRESGRFVPTQLEQIEAEAMKLTTSERADLADRLWLTADTSTSVTAAWDVEIERRIADLKAGRTQSIPAEEVLREARELIRNHGKS